MMSLSQYGVSICPCCNHNSLQPNGGFFLCATCGLAITTQALVRAVRHTHETATFDDAIVTSPN
jgi:hypothetical protein